MALEIWNGRTASQTDADSPLDTTLLDGLRKDLDHLRQVLYGSTDPNFHTPAWGHNHDGVNSKNVVLPSQTPGDYLLCDNPASRPAGNSTPYIKIKETKVGVGGTFRIKFTLLGAYGKIYRNGVAVGWEFAASDVPLTFSEDIGGWSPNDLVQIYCRTYGATTTSVSDFNIYVAAPPIAGRHISY